MEVGIDENSALLK